MALSDPHVVVDRAAFRLDLYRRSFSRHGFVLSNSWPIAVGQVGLETPYGLYQIQQRQRHPDYTYPFSDWVPEELRGVTVPYGTPGIPITGRWLGIHGSVGIHGIPEDEYWTIGLAASHGCIRMKNEDVMLLYDLLPIHPAPPVFIY